ncbi:hypothetical protein LEMLEM_LOCUS22451, partial [Lemmus lemmus]
MCGNKISSACSKCLPVLPRTSPVDRDGHLPPLETSVSSLPGLCSMHCICLKWILHLSKSYN